MVDYALTGVLRMQLEQLKRHQASKVGGQQEPEDSQGFVPTLQLCQVLYYVCID